MPTFNGFVKEFPDIRIDYFRSLPSHPPPAACFLSHVHSDHLQGLEVFRSPFIYCSPATRELILRLERYPARLNLAKGVLESRVVHFKHLRNLLRPIPLNTPTLIELSPGRQIRVSLIDANHCPGSVMFLIEGDDKAILYTGDVRAESWWVKYVARIPCMISYTTGLRLLDNLYLDTTFASKKNPYRSFPSKQDGIKELLQEVMKYPEDTRFYFHSWTFGYEQVWLALSSVLKSEVHIDDYKSRLFRSLLNLRDGLAVDDVAALCGFKLGNTFHPGCLTDNEDVRLHACEKGHGCSIPSSQEVVHIIPIVSRLDDGTELAEQGAGGGYRDLVQDVEVDLSDPEAVKSLMKLCEGIQDASRRKGAIDTILESLEGNAKRLALNASFIEDVNHDLSLKNIPDAIIRSSEASLRISISKNRGKADSKGADRDQLPNVIRFPYSRHSSYDELCDFVRMLRPKDIFPCTVHESTWNPSLSMQSLFGQFCLESTFVHDQGMHAKYADRIASDTTQGQNTSQSQSSHLLEDFDSSQAQSSQHPGLPNDGFLRADLSELHTTEALPSPSHRSPKRPRYNKTVSTTNPVLPFDKRQTQDSADSEGIPRLASSSPQPYRPLLKTSDDGAKQVSRTAAPDSQVSLSDSAFLGSEGSSSFKVSEDGNHDDSDDSKRLARRKEAYKAAKRRSGRGWAAFSTLRALGRADEEEI